jgi:hypothetical protein
MPAGEPRAVHNAITLRNTKMRMHPPGGGHRGLATQSARYGYHRTPAQLKRDGWQVGKYRVERTWRREGPKVLQKQGPGDGGGPTMDARAAAGGISIPCMVV